MIYSLKQKYLQVQPEMRIGQFQYALRLGCFLLFVVLLGLVITPPSLLILFSLMFGVTISGILMAILILCLALWLLGITYKVLLSLIIKRSHDFGYNGVHLAACLALAFLIPVATLCVYVLYSISFVSLDGIVNILIYLSKLVVGIVVSILVVLLFVPGDDGENKYAKDPCNV